MKRLKTIVSACGILLCMLSALGNCPVSNSIKYSAANERYQGLDETGGLWIANQPDQNVAISRFRYAFSSNNNQSNTVSYVYCSYVFANNTDLILKPANENTLFDIIETNTKWSVSRSETGSHFTCVSPDTKDCTFVAA